MYEPIFTFEELVVTVTGLPRALFCVTVSNEEESEIALPTAPEELADALEVMPCKLLLSLISEAVTVLKLAPDWISPFKDNTRVVFAGTM